MAYCATCKRGSWACTCHLSFADKVKGIQFSAGAKTFPRRYYDTQAVEAQFGVTAREQMLEETAGVGPLGRASDGGLYRQDRQTGDFVRATEQEVDALLFEGPAYERPVEEIASDSSAVEGGND
jgi:hypothetical protein